MTMAIRNSDIIRSRKNRIAMIAVALFALVASLSFNDAHAATKTKPVFTDQYAFHLTEEDSKLYNAEYGWCLPTPTDGMQCYVLGSTMVGWLGRGDDNAADNARTYGDPAKGPIMIGDIDKNDMLEAYDAFKAVWGN